MTKLPRYIPGVWKGTPDGMQPLDADAWFEIMHKSRAEIEADERKERQQREQSKTPNATEPL